MTLSESERLELTTLLLEGECLDPAAAIGEIQDITSGFLEMEAYIRRVRSELASFIKRSNKLLEDCERLLTTIREMNDTPVQSFHTSLGWEPMQLWLLFEGDRQCIETGWSAIEDFRERGKKRLELLKNERPGRPRDRGLQLRFIRDLAEAYERHGGRGLRTEFSPFESLVMWLLAKVGRRPKSAHPLIIDALKDDAEFKVAIASGLKKLP